MWDSSESVAIITTAILASLTVRATLLLILATLVVRTLRGKSAAMRHLVWMGTMVGLASLPALTAFLPGWEVLPRWTKQEIVLETDRLTAVVDPQPAKSIFLTDDSLTPGGSVQESVSQQATVEPTLAEQATVELAAVPSTPYEFAPHRRLVPWRWVIPVVWLAGFAVALLPVVVGMISLIRLERRSVLVGDGPLYLAFRSVAARLGVKCRVRVLLSDQRTMPMLWGVLRPAVLVPAVAREWSSERLEVVLTHEMAHVRRADCLSNLAARGVCALYWFHPLVWWAARSLRLESEAACDDLVLKSGCTSIDYAEHLLDVAAGSSGAVPLGSAAIGMAWQSQLEVRLRAILDDGRSRVAPSYTATAGCVMLAAGLFMPVALLRSESLDELPVSVASALMSPASVAAENPFALREVSDLAEGETLPVRLGYIDETSEGSRSIANSGHAVRFRRPENGAYLMAIEMFAQRYGHPTPPAEDFHVYVLDAERKLIEACSVPYGQIEWGSHRWHTLKLPPLKVPDEYYIALAFNPHQTKGVYLAFDSNVKKSHSYIGLPATGFEPVAGGYDWMVRSVLVDEIPKANPFETNDK